uniref:Uncharacterized protein n=1 Tax=Arundo donax TaxID=35708 RepID=A0A0A9HET9_ARUDO
MTQESHVPLPTSLRKSKLKQGRQSVT